jgi:hypothetical protein
VTSTVEGRAASAPSASTAIALALPTDSMSAEATFRPRSPAMRKAYQIEERYRSACQYFLLETVYSSQKKAVFARNLCGPHRRSSKLLFDNRALLTEALFEVKRLWSQAAADRAKVT